MRRETRDRKIFAKDIQLAFCIHGLLIHGFSQLWIKHIWKKFQKVHQSKLEMLHCKAVLHNIYIVVVIYIGIYNVSGVTSNLEIS